MPDLEDYGALLRSGQAAVPDYAADEARKQLLSIQRAQEQRLTAEAKNNLQEQQGFQNDLTTVLAHPSAQGYSALIAKHPKFAAQVKSSWDLLDKNRQSADLQAMSEVYSAAANGKHDLAAGLMQRRIDADRAAGQDTTHDQAIYDALNSGDPVQQKGALGMIGVTLSAVTGPEKFEQTLGQLTKGTTPDIRNVNAGDDVISVDPQTGQARSIYKSPYVKTADGGILERDGTGGGDPASPGAQTTAPGSFDNAVEHVLSNEGGYNPSDMNGAPVNFGINQKANPGVDVKNLTRDQAKQIYHDKYWVPSGAESLPANLQAPYFDVYIRNPAFAKKALKDSGGDPAKFMAASSTYFQQLGQKPAGQPYAEAWANRDAKNTAIATGGVSSAASPATDGAPPGYHWLTPPKKNEPESGYIIDPNDPTGQREIPRPGGSKDPDAQPDTLDEPTTTFYAQQVLAGGQMPTLGMGKQAAVARQQIMKKVAQIAGADGLTGKDLAVQIAHYKAGVETVKNLEKNGASIEQNEQTALANGQQFLDRSRELPGQTEYTGLNSIVQTAQRHLPVAGHDTVAAMDAAWNTFVTEYAKVVAGSPSGAGTLSDSARHEQMETMKSNYSVTQKESAFKQMQADMSNRLAAIKSTIAKRYQSLGERAPGLPGSPSSTPASTGAVQIHSAQEWQALKPGTHYIDPTGVARVKK